ncbi:MAG: T9SS type A sorting domain-containing protein, partial [Bacteroidota bacterium]
RMFFSATAFDQNLGDWNINKVSTMIDIFSNSGLSTVNYDRTLIGWATQVVRQEVNLGAKSITYCAGEEARDELISEFNWSISGDRSDCSEGDGTDILRFTLAEQVSPAVFNDTNHTINFTVFGGSDITKLTPTISLSRGATSSPTSEEAVDFSRSVIYSVTSEDGTSSQDWTVTVTEALNTATDFVSFTFAEASGPVFINLDNHAIAVKVNKGTDLAKLTPSFDLSSGATSDLPSGVARDFTQSLEVPVVYTITAEDGVAKQNWKVIVSTRDVLNVEEELGLAIYPNPSSEYVHVSGLMKMQAQLRSLDGKALSPLKSGNQMWFGVEELPEGIYLLVIQTKDHVITQRIIKKDEN